MPLPQNRCGYSWMGATGGFSENRRGVNRLFLPSSSVVRRSKGRPTPWPPSKWWGLGSRKLSRSNPLSISSGFWSELSAHAHFSWSNASWVLCVSVSLTAQTTRRIYLRQSNFRLQPWLKYVPSSRCKRACMREFSFTSSS